MPPTKRNPDVPADLEQIILTAIAKDPDQRYQTADDLRRGSAAVPTGRPLAAAPVTAIVAEVPTAGAAAVAAAATMQNPAVATTAVDAEPSDESRRSRRRALITALIVLGLIILGGLLIGFFALRGDGGQVTVADVRNKPVAEATATLEADGFEVNVERVVNAQVAVDIVIDQDPAANRAPMKAAT